LIEVCSKRRSFLVFEEVIDKADRDDCGQHADANDINHLVVVAVFIVALIIRLAAASGNNSSKRLLRSCWLGAAHRVVIEDGLTFGDVAAQCLLEVVDELLRVWSLLRQLAEGDRVFEQIRRQGESGERCIMIGHQFEQNCAFEEQDTQQQRRN